MSKFYVGKNQITPDKICITGEDVTHIKKVLRLRCGDNIIIGDGEGRDYLARLEIIEPNSVTASIVDSEPNKSEAPVDVVLFQGLPKSDKMDLIIQKSVELGIKRIVPVVTERTVVKLGREKEEDNKVFRWQRIALESAKQCNRGIIPRVERPVLFHEALKMLQGFDLSLMPYEKENENRLREYLNTAGLKRVSVLIGPEGGFAEEEVQRAMAVGAKTVTLGPRILRTETAGIAVLSILMFTLGDVG